ncbi:hypothetical protein, partial [Neobacillus niacini]|uniref:hypothetical protein n=1 Tax=Neobacillus niacini TaxID=86668 RepID=UPI002FFE8876
NYYFMKCFKSNIKFKESNMSLTVKRGFITIATGKEKYYLLARNLLFSYRQFSKDPLPFGIITDKENEYTKEFDDVVIMSDSSFSYMDKLKLYRYSPYEETIFIDADSLAYKDLNTYWDYFHDASDFSCFGSIHDINSKSGWFYNEGLGKYKDKVSFIPNFNGGIYYLRKTPLCASVFEKAINIANNYSDYSFKMFDKPADEPVLALSMALHNCKPVERFPQSKVFYPIIKKISANIFKQKVSYTTKSKPEEKTAILIHWQNSYTTKALYKFEVEKLMLLRRGGNLSLVEKILYISKLKFYYFKIYDFIDFIIRKSRKVLGKIKRKLIKY